MTALCLCLCLTLLPTAARAENNWESWTIFDGTNLNLSDGSYYLGGNVTISGEITISGAVTFDLNGDTLTCNATDEDMFCVYDGKTLTIKDSALTAPLMVKIRTAVFLCLAAH